MFGVFRVFQLWYYSKPDVFDVWITLPFGSCTSACSVRGGAQTLCERSWDVSSPNEANSRRMLGIKILTHLKSTDHGPPEKLFLLLHKKQHWMHGRMYNLSRRFWLPCVIALYKTTGVNVMSPTLSRKAVNYILVGHANQTCLQNRACCFVSMPYVFSKQTIERLRLQVAQAQVAQQEESPWHWCSSKPPEYLPK